jgi:hypothetical protein
VKRTPLKRGKPPQRKTRVKARNAKRGGSRFPKRRDPAYCEWVRGFACCVRACLTGARMECAHVKSRGAGGGDIGNCVPLCFSHHDQQHRLGIKTFQATHSVDLAAIARNLGERYTPTEAAEW